MGISMVDMKKNFLKIIAILLLFLGIFLLPVILGRLFLSKDSLKASLETVLQKKENVIDAVREDTLAYAILSKEGRTDYGDYLAVFEQIEDNSWNCIYENDFTGLKPWKLQLADIDGDGVTDILTAVQKTTHFDAEEKNRLFIFDFKENKLIKKWTGSQLAGNGRWTDFTAGELLPIPGNELIFIEQSETGQEHLSIYYWFDFGFTLLAKSRDYKDIQKLSVIGENRMQITYDDNKTAVLTVKDGIITEAAQE